MEELEVRLRLGRLSHNSDEQRQQERERSGDRRVAIS
jgi:hypothetical protein